MDQNQENVITTVAALFAVVAIGFGLSFGGTQLLNIASNTTQQAQDVADSNLSVQSVTQEANAQADCGSGPDQYGQDVDTDGDCERSGSTTYTVVLASSSEPEPGINPDCTVSPDPAVTYEQVTFDAGGTDASSSISSYQWDFDDGSNDTGLSVKHSYSDNRDYDTILTVNDVDGNSATTSCPVTIKNQPPTASCEWTSDYPESDSIAAPDGTIYYNGSASDPDGDDASINYEWFIYPPSACNSGVAPNCILNPGYPLTDTGSGGGQYPQPASSDLEIGTWLAELEVRDDDWDANDGTITCTITVQDYEPNFNWNPQQETVWVVADEPATSTEANYQLNPNGSPSIPASDIDLQVLDGQTIKASDVNIERSGSGDVSLTVRKTPNGLETGTYEVIMEATASTTLGTVVKTATTSVRAQTTTEF